MTIRQVIDGPWTIHCDRIDHFRNNDFAVIATATTLDEAWTLFAVKLEQVGECQDCGIITLSGDGAGCMPCQLRASLVSPTECTICSLSKTNFYHLLCGHRMCRQCAKRCVTDDTVVSVSEEEWRKCPYSCSRRFRINQGLQEIPTSRVCDMNDVENSHQVGVEDSSVV